MLSLTVQSNSSRLLTIFSKTTQDGHELEMSTSYPSLQSKSSKYVGASTGIKLTMNSAQSILCRAGKVQTSQVCFQTVSRHSLLPQLSPCPVITICGTTEIRFLEFIIDALLCCQYAGNTAATLRRRDSFTVLILHTSTI